MLIRVYMLYSCKKCFKIFNKQIKKCPNCGGEIKETLNEEYIKNKKLEYKCPHCSHIFSYNFNICPNCGKRSNKCSYCGSIILNNSKICPGCGKKIKY